MTNLALTHLRHSGAIRPLDDHFARLITASDPQADESLALAAALVSYRAGEGHTCIQLHQEGGRRFPASTSESALLPDPIKWQQHLRNSSAVACSEEYPLPYRPLILDPSGRLYLQRYWVYEQRLASAILRRHQQPPPAPDPGWLQAALTRLFGPPPSDTIDWQRIAAASALLHRFTLITGGPGTGKTTTVIKILALLLEQADPQPLRIAMAAPTGKAAVRLQESIRQQKAALAVTPALRERLPEQVVTLHRLLGIQREGGPPRYHPNHPLPFDAIVIDEASMIDLALISTLFAALPDATRVILLGDRDQLASVEAGAVLAELSSLGGGLSPEQRSVLSEVSGCDLAAVPLHADSLGDAIITLQQSHRFAAEQGIGQLASAVNRGDSRAALALLHAADHPEIALLEPATSAARYAAACYRPLLEPIRQQADLPPSAHLAQLERFRCLCALRDGPSGVSGINQAIEQHLRHSGLIPPHPTPWYPGRPVIILRNHYPLGLFNGDTGITLPSAENPNQLKVWFQRPNGDLLALSPTRLPAHQTAFAISVHKSQGSEFYQTLLLLPHHDNPILTRELIYTALTRSIAQLRISAPENLLKQWIKRHIQRNSGLREAIQRG